MGLEPLQASWDAKNVLAFRLIQVDFPLQKDERLPLIYTTMAKKNLLLSVSQFMLTFCFRNNVKLFGDNPRSMGGLKVTCRSVKGQWLRPEDDWEGAGMEPVSSMQ